MQVAFDHGAALERLRGIHRVDDLLLADLIAQAIAGRAEHAGGRRRESGGMASGLHRTRFPDVRI